MKISIMKDFGELSGIDFVESIRRFPEAVSDASV